MTIFTGLIISIPSFTIAFRAARFFTTPFLKKIGFYTYYTNLFFTMPFGKNTLEMHLGTSYDFFKLSTRSPKLLMNHLIHGLVGLCEKIEEGKIPSSTRIYGTLCFFNNHNLERYGFQTKRLNLLQRIIFSFNYLEICLLHTISKKKITIIKMRDVKIAYITADELVKQKNRFISILDRIEEQSAEIIPLRIQRKLAA